MVLQPVLQWFYRDLWGLMVLCYILSLFIPNIQQKSANWLVLGISPSQEVLWSLKAFFLRFSMPCHLAHPEFSLKLPFDFKSHVSICPVSFSESFKHITLHLGIFPRTSKPPGISLWVVFLIETLFNRFA